MLKACGINQRRDDEMNEHKNLMPMACVVAGVSLAWLIGVLFFWDTMLQQHEKTALEIKILQHELAAYEAMEKELKSE